MCACSLSQTDHSRLSCSGILYYYGTRSADGKGIWLYKYCIVITANKWVRMSASASVL